VTHTGYPRTIADLGPGDHLCCLYETEEEHRAVLTPFLRQGLERGEKVVYIVDTRTGEAILDYLRDDRLTGPPRLRPSTKLRTSSGQVGQGLDVEFYLARGQLVILTLDDAYLREGIFDPEDMIALLRAETEQALVEGYPALRVTGEMAWASRGMPGSEQLIEYEAKLNEFVPGSKCLAICQYDRRRFAPEVLVDVLRTHPVIAIGRAVYDNPYYIPPAELLGGDLPAVMLCHWMQNLVERRRAEREIRRQLERIEALREVDKAIISTLDLTEVLNIILEELEKVIPYHSAAIFLLSDGTAKLAAGRGLPNVEPALQVSFPVEEDALTCELLREKRPLVFADAQADERFLARGGMDYVRSWIGVPLIAKGRAVGFLTIDHREPGVYDEESADTAQAFGSQVAIAIENARLQKEAQRGLTERKQAEEELQYTLTKLRKALGGIIQAMTLTVEARDPYTAGHQRRVGDLARAIGEEMGVSEEQIDGIRMAGAIHDIGKICVPAEILSKPGRLSDLEYSMIKTHPEIAYDILKTIEFPWPVAEIVLQHHERMNGSGYPQGLSGEDILLEARILGVADVVEAMASHRPYRSALGIDRALEEISQNKGVLYDSEVVDACVNLFVEKGFVLK
jgi:response regulator RpfG family c-di-GMP phosphodiesterase